MNFEFPPTLPSPVSATIAAGGGLQGLTRCANRNALPAGPKGPAYPIQDKQVLMKGNLRYLRDLWDSRLGWVGETF